MMKLWRYLCFLVLVVLSLSRGQNQTTLQDDEDQNNITDSPQVPQPYMPPQNETTNSTTVSQPNLLDETSADEEDPGQAANQTENVDNYNGMEEVNDSSEATATTTTAVPGGGKDGDGANMTNGVSIATTTTSSKPATTDNKTHSSWAYVILVLIILMIIVLCVILFFLRRASKTYSFDLQRPVLATQLNEPIGTFEPVYLDDLDRPSQNGQATADDLSPPPVANGTTPHAEDNGTNGEIALHEQPDANSLETSLTSSTTPSLAEDPADKASITQNSANLLFDSVGEEQQNENNNNPSVCSSDPFVEINLNDPAWGDQLFTFPEVTVLPLSPFSFSSSSSSSS